MFRGSGSDYKWIVSGNAEPRGFGTERTAITVDGHETASQVGHPSCGRALGSAALLSASPSADEPGKHPDTAYEARGTSETGIPPDAGTPCRRSGRGRCPVLVCGVPGTPPSAAVPAGLPNADEPWVGWAGPVPGLWLVGPRHLRGRLILDVTQKFYLP